MPAPAEVTTLLLTGTATVYGRAADGRYTVPLRAGLASRLLHLNSDGAPSGEARAELAARRRFVWDAAYTMPAFSQIEVEGLRWNPVTTGAIETMRWIDGTALYKKVDVIRDEAEA
jgi:hypothetical protein